MKLMPLKGLHCNLRAVFARCPARTLHVNANHNVTDQPEGMGLVNLELPARMVEEGEKTL